jgi:cysteine-rich repeat protein
MAPGAPDRGARRLVSTPVAALVALAVCGGWTTHAGAQAAVARGTIVVQAGDPVPGFPDGTTFATPDAPTINASGVVAFAATIRGPGIDASNAAAIWAGVPGALGLVARKGDQAPGTPAGVVFDLFLSLPIVSADGRAAFLARLRGPGVEETNREGIWRGTTPGDLQLVAREGEPAPDTEAGTVFDEITQSGLTGASDGGVVFVATLAGPAVGLDNHRGVWTGLPGAVRLLVRTGSQAPDLQAGTAIGTLTNVDPAINNAGTALFLAGLAGAGNTDNDVVYLGPPGAVEAIAVRGDPVPEVGDGITILRPLSPAAFGVNDVGQASFGATLGPLLVGESQSIWRADTAGRELVVRATDAAPGTGASFGNFFATAINRDGILAVSARLTGADIGASNRDGLWIGTPAGLTLVARESSGLSTAVGDFRLTTLQPSAVINANAQVAFAGTVTPVGGAGSAASIWFGAPGALSPAVISGQAIDFGGGDVRTVSFLLTGFPGRDSGNQDGRPSGFSDNGQVAFRAGLPSTAAIVLVPAVSGGTCGDGLITGGEQCDDGGTAGGDGCSATCTVEAGFRCTGEPSVCEPVAGLDHYLSYRTRDSRGDLCAADAPANAGAACQTEEDCGGTEGETAFCVASGFPRDLRVTLIGALESEPVVYDVRKPASLCTPARKSGEEVVDPDTHLRGYVIALTRGRCAPDAPANAGSGCTRDEECGGDRTTGFCVRQPRPEKHPDLRVVNQFHAADAPLRVDAIEPDRLLVPTSKGLGGAPAGPPEPVSADHYRCYRVSVAKGSDRFASITGVPVDDQFTGGDRRLDLRKPSRLCVPVSKDGEVVRDATKSLMCYQAVPARGEPRHARVEGLVLENQFGFELADTVKEEEFCVPSAVSAGAPPP